MLINQSTGKNIFQMYTLQFTVHGTVHRQMCILYNERDATYTILRIVISALHVSGGFSTHHQEPIKLYVQPWLLSYFPAVYRWCRWVGTLLMMGRKTAQNM
jgi:hypothetical protein